jgi:CHAT domain-containing protein
MTNAQKASGRDRPRIHWCPVGSLVFLPIHAAGVYEEGALECCCDYVVSSYTPTLSALRRAGANLVPRTRRSLTLLAAAAPTCATSRDLPFLHNVRPEVAEVARLGRTTGHVEVLEYGRSSAATTHEVAEALPRVDIVHLACHGVQDQEDPLESGFYLSNGKLTVSELMDIKLDQAFLAFLSACETAKGDKKHPDQTIHLAAAMLFCGFRSAVATMWCVYTSTYPASSLSSFRSISDSDGPAVARAFYETLFAEEVIDADAVAYALDEAVSKLRGEDLSAPLRWASFIHVGA